MVNDVQNNSGLGTKLNIILTLGFLEPMMCQYTVEIFTKVTYYTVISKSFNHRKIF